MPCNAPALFDPTAVSAYFDLHRDEFWLLITRRQQPPAVLPGLHRRRRPTEHQTVDTARDLPHRAVDGRRSPATCGASNTQTRCSTPPAAARSLLVFLWYARGGGGAVHPLLPAGTKWQKGWLREKVSLHPVGETLEDTLRLHLINPDDVADLLPGGVGVPSWEQPPPPATRPLGPPNTILEQLTGRFEKAVLLHPSANGAVGTATIASGRRRDFAQPEHDPFAVRWDNPPPDDPALQQRPRLPYAYLKGSAGRAPWRDLHNYHAHRAANRTIVVKSVRDLDAATAGQLRAWVTVAHQADNAKDIMWGLSAVPPTSLLDPDAGLRAEAFINDCDEIAGRLKAAVKAFHKEASGRKSLPSGALTNSLAVYWGHMERLFARTADAGHNRREIRDAAREVFDHAVAAYGQRLAAPKRTTPNSDIRPEPALVTAARLRAGINFRAPKKTKQAPGGPTTP